MKNKFRKDVIKMVLFINKNVTFYKTSVSNANKIYDPVQGVGSTQSGRKKIDFKGRRDTFEKICISESGRKIK